MATFQQDRHLLYSLTSLQIGDMQSYVSKLYVYVGKEKLVFFVDNGPWSAERSLRSKPVELWQLMVTQSRISPFANRNVRSRLIERIHGESDENMHKNKDDFSSAERWSLKRRLFHKDQNNLIKFFHDLFQIRLRSVVPMQELSHFLYGCVTFELEWKDIRGINYLNELQTDTSVALELKLLAKRDFGDMKEATAFYGLEHPDSDVSLTSLDGICSSPKRLLQNESLESSFFGADEDLSSGTSSSDEFFSDLSISVMDPSYLHDTSDSSVELYDAVCHLGAASLGTDSCSCSTAMKNSGIMEEECILDAFEGSCSIEKLSNSAENWPIIEDKKCGMTSGAISSDIPDDVSSSSSLQSADDEQELLVYTDTLLIFRFCDPILPYKLKDIITADQTLLKMLESGLPSWVIFLQSYPVFRSLYRPWMRPLAKTLYILVSIVTVIIGFYDLYKNVPVLKATAARICGPFFEWIEAWEMVSRVKYLGTVLFLQNWEKAFRWLLLVFSTIRKLSNLIFQPLLEPLEDLAEIVWPAWNAILDAVWGLVSLLWMTCMSIYEYTNFILQLIVLPFIWLLTAISSLVTWILCPIIFALWGFIIFPLRLTMLLVDYIVAAFCSIYKAFQNFWFLVNSSFQLLSVTGPQAANSSTSTLRLLWNDIFSQVFRAVRSIVNVFVAFFTTCNRHRLSIYNHTEAFLSQLRGLVKSTPRRVADPRIQALDTRGFDNEGHKRSSRGSAIAAPSKKTRKKVHLAGN
ncbi:hypothetical protein GOP47_0017792 [Adiantum capillus-veneris]|uniref:Uncharacterized protein n=1 Tax=Adiantum capillus-veneris TaxID=13818 RepID=A0A9D4UG30_ADICA|nr:hypothetical protein GOP47_0017792 [Adiantum capillus-veneris]